MCNIGVDVSMVYVRTGREMCGALKGLEALVTMVQSSGQERWTGDDVCGGGGGDIKPPLSAVE
jgi:hypothetical protein